MFTGIVEEMGRIVKVERGISSIKLTIEGKRVLERISLGDSIAVNGVCLTVTRFNDRQFTADVMPETLRRTNLKDARPGDRVNLERALTPSSFIGGHLVSGHIDGTGSIGDIKKEDNAIWLKVEAPHEIMEYIIPKGSIAVDGASLTVARVDKEAFWVSLIPHSAAVTTLGFKKPGDRVNIECDMIGKYVKKFVDRAVRQPGRSLTREFLQEHGF